MENTIRLWACPKCGALVEADEAEPPITFDAEELLKMHTLRFRFENMGKAMRRFRLAMLFCRFGCWLAGIDLEYNDNEEGSHSLA